MTGQELKERFPVEAKDPSEYETHLYEIRPLSDSELLRHLRNPNE